MKFDDAFAEYLRKQTNVQAESTIGLYLRIARRIIAARKTPAAWLDAHFATPRAKGTVFSYLAAARHLHDFLKITKPGIAGVYPDLNLKKATKKRQINLADALTDERLEQYVREVFTDPDCSPEARCILGIMPYTGLRINEACSLERAAVQRRGNVLVLHIRHGKGDKERFVPLGKKARKILQDWMKKHRTSGKWMFPSPDPAYAGQHISPDTIRGHHRRIRARLGPGWEKLRTHDLRHTFASRLIQRGAKIEEVQDLLGHDSITTTRGYIHSNVEHLRGYVDDL